MAIMLKKRGERMLWYQDELLHMAKELGHRLLPAFNTSSGLPYPRVRHLLRARPGLAGDEPTGRGRVANMLGRFVSFLLPTAESGFDIIL